jgi:RNA polymerase sigma-32 factor
VSKLIPVKKQELSKLSPLQAYLQEIAHYPLLEPEEEFELAKAHYEHGDVKAAHRLITSNLRLVVKIANEFNKIQTHVLDLIQEGNYGLMKAVKKFNPYKGVKLSSYSAWWIRAYILKYLMDQKSHVKIATTAAQRKLFYNLQKETERLISENATVDVETIARVLDVPEKDVLEMQKRLANPDISVDTPTTDDGDARFGDTLESPGESIEDVLADRQVKLIFSQYVEEFRASLAPRDREVFELRMLKENPPTLQAVGEQYGITRERVRQIEQRIIKKLKEFVAEKGTLSVDL